MGASQMNEYGEIFTKTNSEEWQTSLQKRLPSLQGFLAQDDWLKGIDPYLRSIAGHAILNWLAKGESAEYCRGFLAALRIVWSLPVTVDGAIKQGSEEQKKGPKGEAGY